MSLSLDECKQVAMQLLSHPATLACKPFNVDIRHTFQWPSDDQIKEAIALYPSSGRKAAIALGITRKNFKERKYNINKFGFSTVSSPVSLEYILILFQNGWDFSQVSKRTNLHQSLLLKIMGNLAVLTKFNMAPKTPRPRLARTIESQWSATTRRGSVVTSFPTTTIWTNNTVSVWSPLVTFI
jgi:hypothetical protein